MSTTETARDRPEAPRRVEDRTAALLAELSLDEKLAQLGSYWDDRRSSDQIIAPLQDVFSRGRPSFDEAIRNGIGHLTRVLGTNPVDAVGGAARLAAAQRAVRASSRLGIPAIAHEECLTGFTTLGATVYPIPLAWGASFDPELVEQVAAAIGADMRAVGVHQGLSPLLDVVRDYRWGRVEETIGEDPYLVGQIGAAYARGLESAGVVATLKHFAGYSASEGGRNHAPVAMGPREVEDILLPPFETAIREGGARSVMNSYSAIDGVPSAADPQLLTEVLRSRWGFTGTVVSDYWSVPFLKSKHGIAATVAEAGALALTAGLDVELPDTGGYGLLGPLVESGELDEAIVDRAVERVLRQKIELGLLDEDWEPEAGTTPVVDLDSPRNRTLARRLAEESIVLLDNPHRILPFDDEPRTIALIGPCANDPRALLGCYSYPIHVLPRHPELGLGIDVSAIPAALADELPPARIVTTPGCPLTEPDRSGIPAAVEAARAADAVVAVVGDRSGMFGRGTSGEGSDAPDLELPGVQSELLEALLDSGTPVVILVLSGRPYALGRFRDRAAAIVQAFMPGAEGARAIAGVLSGRVNPSGRLPVEVPVSPGGSPHGYLGPALRHDGGSISSTSVAPLFPFGHGLSYSEFEVSSLDVDSHEVAVDGTVVARATVTNTGDRAGSTVVQLYGTDPVASVTRPVIELLGFHRVALDAGATATIEFELHTDRLSFTGREGVRIVEPGEYRLSAGLSSRMLSHEVVLRLTGTTRRVPEGRVLTTKARDVPPSQR